MNHHHTIRALALALALPATGLLAAPAADAAPVSKGTSTFHGVIAECAPGDELVASFATRESGREFRDGRQTVHLQLTGTITRTGTGVAGAYAERQNDVFDADGTEHYGGVLGSLVVRGGGGFTWAGHAVFAPGADPVITHGLVPLMEADDDDFVALVCHALR